MEPQVTANLLIAVTLTIKETDTSFHENKTAFVSYRTDRQDELVAALEQHGIPEELKEHGIRKMSKLLDED